MAAISSKINSTSFCRFWLALERFYDAGVPTDGRRVISSAPLTAERRNVAGCRANWPTPATSLHTSVPQQRNTEWVRLLLRRCTFVCVCKELLAVTLSWIVFSDRWCYLLLFAFWWRPIISTPPRLRPQDPRAGCWKGKTDYCLVRWTLSH